MAATNRSLLPSFAFIPELKSAWAQVYGTKLAFFLPFVILVVAYTVFLRIFPHEMAYSSSLTLSDFIGNALRDTPQLFVYYFFYLGFANLGLRRVRGESVTVSDFANLYTSSRLTPIISYSLFMVVYYFLGSVCAAFLGLYVSNILIPIFLIVLLAVWLKFFMAAFYIVDDRKNAGFKEALMTSWARTRSHLLMLFVVMLIAFGLSLLGALTLLVGYIWFIPLVAIYSARVYEYLLSA